MSSQWVENMRTQFSENYSVFTLKTIIVIWAIMVIIVVLFFVDNPYALAAIFLYEALP